MTVITPDGCEKFLLANILPWLQGENEADGAICILWDITALSEDDVAYIMEDDEICKRKAEIIRDEMRLLTNALAAAEKKHAASLEMKRNFVRGVSHEIRTPLNVVFAGLQLIETQMFDQVSPEVLSLIREIKQSCQDGVDILDDLLAYEKLDGKILALEKEAVCMNGLVKECLKPFLMQARVKDVKIEYTEQKVPDPQTGALYSDYIVHVDHFKVRQVVRNLISNAVKFTPAHGTIRCEVSWKPQSSDPNLTCDNGFVRVEVTDTGVGLAKESQEKLFKEIIQFDARANQGGGGSGLGLWLSKSLVSLNGGTIGVWSKGLGHGSTFFVEFPLCEKPSEIAEGMSSAGMKESRSLQDLSRANEESRFNRMLVVDDSLLSRKMVARLLRYSFNEVVEANDGVEALSIFHDYLSKDKFFDVILLDNQMPNMNGLECAAELRRLGFKSALIGLTGYGEKEQIEEFTSLGADYVMVKPLNHAKLLKVAKSKISSFIIDFVFLIYLFRHSFVQTSAKNPVSATWQLQHLIQRNSAGRHACRRSDHLNGYIRSICNYSNEEAEFSGRLL